MKVRPTLLSTSQPKCYVGNGMLIKSGHFQVELDPLEEAVIVRALSETGMLNPIYLKKLKDHMTKDDVKW